MLAPDEAVDIEFHHCSTGRTSASNMKDENQVPLVYGARYVKYYVNLNVNLEFFQTGWIVKDIIMNPSPQVVPRKRKNATKYVTSRAKKSTDSYTLLIIYYLYNRSCYKIYSAII